jgi:hypothetical protein
MTGAPKRVGRRSQIVPEAGKYETIGGNSTRLAGNALQVEKLALPFHL